MRRHPQATLHQIDRIAAVWLLPLSILVFFLCCRASLRRPRKMPGLFCYLNGEFIPHADAKVSVDDRGFLFADGMYEVTKACKGHLFGEAEHMVRLRRGLTELRIDSALPVVDELPAIARKLLQLNGLADKDATVYVQITRGVAPRYHAFPAADTPPTVYVIAKPLAAYPASFFEDGVTAVTMPDMRWKRCDIKTISLLPNVLAKQKAKEHDAYECLLVREDKFIVEASHSNVFAVIDGQLWTPARDNILPGISRDVIVAKAGDLGITVVETAIPIARWADITELFTTSTGPDVAPIVKVDDKVVGDGKVGPVTKQLLAAFAGRWLEEDKATAAARMAAAGVAVKADALAAKAPEGAASGAGAVVTA